MGVYDMTKFESRGCSFIVAIAMLVFLLPISIVNAQTQTLTDAILKTSNATSMESNGKLSLTFKAEGLSNQDQQDFEMVSDILNNLQMNFNSKVSGNSDGTISRQYVKMSANVAGSPYSGEVWSDINLAGKTPIVKEIVKSPQLFEMLSPEYKNKYMLLDLAQIEKMPEMQGQLGSMDFGKMMSENKELQGMVINLIEKYSSQLGSNYDFISHDGNVYNVKISDAQFKDIIRNVVNLTAKNKEIQNIINDLIVSQMKNSGASTQEINTTSSDMNQMFTTLESAGFLEQFNETMDKLKDVAILGEQGIDITYTIDKNGYVIKTKGIIDVVIDIAKLNKAFGEDVMSASGDIPTGIYTVGIGFEVNNSNINGNVNIDLPKLTSANSFTISELLNELQGDPQGETTIITRTITGGQLPKTSTHLYDVLLIGAVLTLIGVVSLKRRKHYE